MPGLEHATGSDILLSCASIRNSNSAGNCWNHSNSIPPHPYLPLWNFRGNWHRPGAAADIGMETAELREILLTLAEYCRSEKLPHTIIYETDFSAGAIEKLISDLA